MATRATEEAKEKALREKLAADREAALSKLRDAVTVTLISKELRSSLSTGHLGDSVDIVVGYRNNTNREVSGVKGTLVAKDQFDDACSRRESFQRSDDTSGWYIDMAWQPISHKSWRGWHESSQVRGTSLGQTQDYLGARHNRVCWRRKDGCSQVEARQRRHLRHEAREKRSEWKRER